MYVMFWLRILEIIAIVGIGICQWFFPDIVEKVADPPDIVLSTSALSALAVLSFVPIAGRSMQLRASLLALQLALVTAGSVYGITRLWDILYMIVFAKAGLLLSLRALVISWVVALVAFVAGKEARYVLTQPAIFSLSPLQHVFHLLVFGRLVNFELQVVFASLCTYALGREQTARRERERLNKEIAELAKQVERFRMSRDIHDSIGHLMTSICQQLDFASAAITKKPEKAYAALHTVRSSIARLEEELLQFSQAPPGDFDFAAAFAELLEQYERDRPFQIEVEQNEFVVPPHLGHDLFNILKEALHNVRKYARASKVKVSMTGSDGVLSVHVSDDGVGFDPTQVGSERFGLRGIRERLERAGGQFTLRSAPGEGTEVSVTVPVGK